MIVVNKFFWLVFFSMLVVQIFAQADYREKLQATLDSIVTPYEEMTGADFGPELGFSFKEAYKGVMLKGGSEYSGKLNVIEFVAGDSVRFERLGILGGTFAYANFESYEESAIMGEEDINSLVALEDSIGFWNQFEKIKKVRPREFAQYWMVLDCQEENYTLYEKVERVFMNFDNTSLNANIIDRDDRILLKFNFSTSYGKALYGLGCADKGEHYIEFMFEDGTVLKKNNIEFESCQTMEVDISEDLVSFEKAILELNFSLSKKEKRLILDNEIAQNQINLKIDCLTNTK